jgi:hypothetical protein
MNLARFCLQALVLNLPRALVFNLPLIPSHGLLTHHFAGEDPTLSRQYLKNSAQCFRSCVAVTQHLMDRDCVKIQE